MKQTQLRKYRSCLWVKPFVLAMSAAFLGAGVGGTGLSDTAVYQEEEIEQRELLDASAVQLRKARELTRKAKRSSEWEVVKKSKNFETSARVFYLGVQQEDDADSLQELHAQMLGTLRVLERTVEQASEDLSDAYNDLEKAYFYVRSLLEELDANEKKVWVQSDTYFKSSTTQSMYLSAAEKCKVSANQVMYVRSIQTTADGKHLEVFLAEELPGCSFGGKDDFGYLYSDHILVEY